jgi:polyferredoxin
MAGQAILLIAFLLLGARLLSWGFRGSEWATSLENTFITALLEFKLGPVPFSYSQVVDYALAGVLGMGLYFHFSGRVWCRFFCPLSALMHIYARFTKFRIFPDKSKCISCNACTAHCHQGIDVMAFAQRGTPMTDPECVRCSACVTVCPTGTLSFGSVGKEGAPVMDRWLASPVQIRESSQQGSAGAKT